MSDTDPPRTPMDLGALASVETGMGSRGRGGGQENNHRPHIYKAVPLQQPEPDL